MSESSEFLLPNVKKTYKSRQQITLIALNITLSSFYFGYCVVYFGQLDIQAVLKILSFDIDPNLAKGLLNGCIPIGALFGALSSSFLISKFSRRNCLLIVNVCALIVGGLIYIPNFYSLLFFRLCQGFFVGIYSALASVYIKQLSPTEISGTLGSYVQLNVCFGVFFGCILAYILKKITGDQTGKDFWFIMYGITEITLLVQTVVLVLIFPYETPKYLLSIGKEEEAKDLIKIIYKEEYVEQILEEKKADWLASRRQQVAVSEVQSEAKSRLLPNIVAICLAAFQQLSGVNAIVVYGVDIASKATSRELSALMPSLINLEQVIGTFITGILLSKFGRKSILLIGAVFESVSCALIGIGFYLKNDSIENSSLGESLILIGLIIFMGVFGVSLGPIVWLCIPEIVQPKVIPFSTAMNWICASIIIILFPIITENVLNSNPTLLFFIFTVLLILFLVFFFRSLIETKDKTQKAIHEEYAELKMC